MSRHILCRFSHIGRMPKRRGSFATILVSVYNVVRCAACYIGIMPSSTIFEDIRRR